MSRSSEESVRTETAGSLTAGIVEALPYAADPFALSLNENPFPPLPAVRSALMKAIDVGNRYPEFLPNRLRRLIAGRIGVADEQVVLGNGATGVVLHVLQAMTSPGDRIVFASPTFDGYPILAQMTRMMPVSVPIDERGHQDLATMADAATDAKIVVLCRPHNPTGTVESVADVERFVRHVPDDTVVLLDEAYVEYVAPQHRLDASALVRRFPNVVALHTFSKAYGLAGLRIGYGLGAPEMTKTLWTMQEPFGISITSTVAVAASYDAENQLQRRIRLVSAQRRRLQDWLRSMGVYSTDAQANFLYLPPAGRPWGEVFDRSGPQVRHYPDGAVRITVGSRLSTKAVVNAINRSHANHTPPRKQPDDRTGLALKEPGVYRRTGGYTDGAPPQG